MRTHLSVFLLAATLAGQTAIDLASQSKNVDFSAHPFTRPIKTGTATPPTCLPGYLFFKTDATPGQNLLACTAPDTWSATGGGPHSHALSGDASGDLAAVRVVAIHKRPVADITPVQGQALAWNAASLRWEPQSIPAAGAGPGATQLSDLALSATATTLTIGARCSRDAPCNVGFSGSLVYRFTAPATATLSAGTGSAFVYISRDGALTVAHNLTLTCAGCNPLAGTAIPPDAVPIGRWNATANVWDTAGGTDMRPFLSSNTITPGYGLTLSTAPGASTIAINQAVIGFRVAPPATANVPCNSGAWAADKSFHYLCVAPNTWLRNPLAPW